MRKKHFILCAVGVLTLPLLLNLLMFLNLPTSPNLHGSDWLNFWGGYLGGITGSVAALIALWVSYRQADKHHKDERLSMLPALDLHVSMVIPQKVSNDIDFILFSNPGETLGITWINSQIANLVLNSPRLARQIRIKNIGQGPAFSIMIQNGPAKVCIGSIGAGMSQTAILKLNSSQNSDYTEFIFTFKDVYENQYQQLLSFKQENNELTILPIAPPELVLDEDPNPSCKTD